MGHVTSSFFFFIRNLNKSDSKTIKFPLVGPRLIALNKRIDFSDPPQTPQSHSTKSSKKIGAGHFFFYYYFLWLSFFAWVMQKDQSIPITVANFSFTEWVCSEIQRHIREEHTHLFSEPFVL